MNNWRTTILDWFHVNVSGLTWIEQLIFASVLLLVIAFIDKLCKIIISKFVPKIVRATAIKWDDVLLDRKVLDKIVAIIPAILLVLLLPFVFINNETLYALAQRLCWLYLVGVILRMLLNILSAISHILTEKESFKDKPIKGAVQMIQVILFVLGVIVMISIIVDKSPMFLLTGIGASAAVLMLVFQDLILGLVAGIQLSANNMMQVGDWVVVKDKGIDGTVIEITLTTVKVRNWDYTISTIQPQALVNGSFVNWSNMFKSGGRRIARTINIDMHSVRFISDDELMQWKDNTLVTEYITEVESKISEALQRGESVAAKSLKLTNLGLFRIYLQQYISTHPTNNGDFLSMVRLLEPNQYGIPLQVYYFTNTTVWVEYEAIQSALFEHILAILPEFGLRVFQVPSGDDIRDKLETLK